MKMPGLAIGVPRWATGAFARSKAARAYAAKKNANASPEETHAALVKALESAFDNGDKVTITYTDGGVSSTVTSKLTRLNKNVVVSGYSVVFLDDVQGGIYISAIDRVDVHNDGVDAKRRPAKAAPPPSSSPRPPPPSEADARPPWPLSTALQLPPIPRDAALATHHEQVVDRLGDLVQGHVVTDGYFRDSFDVYDFEESIERLLRNPLTEPMILALDKILSQDPGKIMLLPPKHESAPSQIQGYYSFRERSITLLATAHMRTRAGLDNTVAHETAHLVVHHLGGNVDPTHLVTRARLFSRLAAVQGAGDPAGRANLLDARERDKAVKLIDALDQDRALMTDWQNYSQMLQSDPGQALSAFDADTAHQLKRLEETDVKPPGLAIDPNDVCLFGANGFNPSDPDHVHTMRRQQLLTFQEYAANWTSDAKKEDLKRWSPCLAAYYAAENQLDCDEFEAAVAKDRKAGPLTTFRYAMFDDGVWNDIYEGSTTETYHASGYDPNAPEDRSNARVEEIARLLGGYAGMTPEKAARQIPHFHAYFLRTFQPLIEAFVANPDPVVSRPHLF